jgi:hypothetical protein
LVSVNFFLTQAGIIYFPTGIAHTCIPPPPTWGRGLKQLSDTDELCGAHFICTMYIEHRLLFGMSNTAKESYYKKTRGSRNYISVVQRRDY